MSATRAARPQDAAWPGRQWDRRAAAVLLGGCDGEQGEQTRGETCLLGSQVGQFSLQSGAAVPVVGVGVGGEELLLQRSIEDQHFRGRAPWQDPRRRLRFVLPRADGRSTRYCP